MTKTRKYKNAQVNAKMALVMDDLLDNPRRPRGIKVYGTGKLVEREGRRGLAPYIEFMPQIHWSWGIEGPVFVDDKAVFHRVKWTK
jgi:hypothetical protein